MCTKSFTVQVAYSNSRSEPWKYTPFSRSVRDLRDSKPKWQRGLRGPWRSSRKSDARMFTRVTHHDVTIWAYCTALAQLLNCGIPFPRQFCCYSHAHLLSCKISHCRLSVHLPVFRCAPHRSFAAESKLQFHCYRR